MEEDPLSGDITMLRGSYEGSYRPRVGDWRVIFTLRPNQEPRTVDIHRALDLAAERAIGPRTKLIAITHVHARRAH